MGGPRAGGRATQGAALRGPEQLGGRQERIMLGGGLGGRCGPGLGGPSHTHPRVSGLRNPRALGLVKEETTQGGEPPCGYPHTRQAGRHAHSQVQLPAPLQARTHTATSCPLTHTLYTCVHTCVRAWARVPEPTCPQCTPPHTHTLHTCIDTHTPTHTPCTRA